MSYVHVLICICIYMYMDAMDVVVRDLPICKSSSSHPSKRVMVWMSASLVYQFEKTLLHAGAVALLRVHVWEDSESESESKSVSRLGA